MNSKGIDIIIPQDIRAYKAKAFGPLTIRQSIAVFSMIIIAIVTISVEKNVFQLEQTSLIPALIFCIFPAVFGFGDLVVGMPMEVYLKRVFFAAFIAPRHRAYVSHSYFDIMDAKMIEIRQAKIKAEAKQNKKNKKTEKKPEKINYKKLSPELRLYH